MTTIIALFGPLLSVLLAYWLGRLRTRLVDEIAFERLAIELAAQQIVSDELTSNAETLACALIEAKDALRRKDLLLGEKEVENAILVGKIRISQSKR